MSGGVREAAADEARNEAYTIFSDLSEVKDDRKVSHGLLFDYIPTYTCTRWSKGPNSSWDPALSPWRPARARRP